LQIFKEAYSVLEYDYYHLISGVHFPLKSKNEIFDYFDSLKGKSLLIPMRYSEYEVTLKIRRYNFFTKYFKDKYFEKIVQFIWKSLIFVQKILNIKKNKDVNYIKASNWVSVSRRHIDIILNNEKSIIKQFKYSFCGDEFFYTIFIAK
jgi:Core-2/I-Branching enzyme.